MNCFVNRKEYITLRQNVKWGKPKICYTLPMSKNSNNSNNPNSSLDTVAEAKIHILYLVDRVPGVTYHQLMDACMSSLYVEFFAFADAYEELIAGNLMDRTGAEAGAGDTLGTTEVLALTAGGKAVLKDLEGALNDSLRGALDQIVTELAAVHDEVSRITASKALKDGRYEVTLTYRGDNGTFSVSVTADSEEKADAAINNWRARCRSLSEDLLTQLFTNS
ncbi:protein of unknown function [Ruminococcaceae bacterium YRB3002]|nr:protein of unknown function [Ruminococcaceae bacterium YRB3002]